MDGVLDEVFTEATGVVEDLVEDGLTLLMDADPLAMLDFLGRKVIGADLGQLTSKSLASLGETGAVRGKKNSL